MTTFVASTREERLVDFAPRAGVAQLAERQPSKLHVASSNLVSRSSSLAPCRVANHELGSTPR